MNGIKSGIIQGKIKSSSNIQHYHMPPFHPSLVDHLLLGKNWLNITKNGKALCRWHNDVIHWHNNPIITHHNIQKFVMSRNKFSHIIMTIQLIGLFDAFPKQGQAIVQIKSKSHVNIVEDFYFLFFKLKNIIEGIVQKIWNE